MAQQSYWKTWILVILALGGVRLLTSAFRSPIPNPQAKLEPTLNTQPNTIVPSPPVPEASAKKAEASPRLRSRGVANTLRAPSTNPPVPGDVNAVPEQHAKNQTFSDWLRERGTALPKPKLPEPSSKVAESEVLANRVNSGNSAAVKVPATFFTIGSTKDEVLTVQGAPTEFGEYVWKYGLSSVHFQNGRVASWDVFPGQPLRVKLIPSASASGTLSYFTVGSTKDDVLVVQGTPTEFGEYVWKYGLSSVHFHNGKVTSWSIFPGQPLKARSTPVN